MDNNVLAAKAGDQSWLPLQQHLNDTGSVMERLLEKYVSPSVITASGMEPEAFRSVSLFVAYTHDIGKATYVFQKKMCDALPGYSQRLRANGFEAGITNFSDETPHALAGAVILNQIYNIPESICYIVASHHGRPIAQGKENKFDYQIHRRTINYYTEKSYEAYEASWREIVENALLHGDVRGCPELSVKAQMIITGLLIMADWIASCETFFPHNELYNTGVRQNRLDIAFKTLNLQPFHRFDMGTIDDTAFLKRFKFYPNELQKKVIGISEMTINPGIMVIEAPMGLGKTEAALSAAEIYSCAAETGGIFFGLPTRGTADAMFDRVKDWADLISLNSNASIGLAHSSADFNESYDALKVKVYDEDDPGVSVNTWMTGRHRKLLPDFVIGTVDQALFTVLKKKFLMLLHIGIAGKTIVIDEVHAYDDYMMSFMNTMLSWLSAYKVPVILLSATLTKERRNELISAYTGIEVDTQDDSYPLISWSDGDKIQYSPICINNIKRTAVTVRYLLSEALPDTLNNLLSEGGCAGIICDTVSRAQVLYEEIKKKISDEYTVLLLHSRFLPKDRSRIEEKVLDLVGKKSVERNKVIIVGTQVLEQSLDIDFDVLFTEKCPIDLLLQRIGRLHRHNRKERPLKVSEPVCFILSDEESCRSAKIYNDYIIRRTDECLKENINIVIPDQVRLLTESVYDLTFTGEANDKQEYIDRKQELKNLSKAYLLPSPKNCHFKGMLTAEAKGNDSVRYGINSIDVILLEKKGKSFITRSGMELLGDSVPSVDESKELLQNRLSLRYEDDLIHEVDTDEGIGTSNDDFKIWRRNPFLQGEFFLVSDEDWIFTVGKHSYSYSNEYGWRREK